jgi:hypothetical protein
MSTWEIVAVAVASVVFLAVWSVAILAGIQKFSDAVATLEETPQ